ncbi:MAG: hypothetical protein HQ567_33625 [Candidatus Nealsonbacteria bacterium]|nr:hypothetical protein [Candidatus Nealsonbacteria bacterium]
MSSHETSAKEKGFGQRLEDLRIQIDALPTDKRPHLYAMADEVQRQHVQMRKTCSAAAATASHLRRSARPNSNKDIHA